MKQQLRILCPHRYLGFMPFQETSFWMGAETRPDYYCCTSGSPDIGADLLGNDISVSPYEWQKHNLELLLLASRKQEVPLLIGSSGDTGTNSRVDLFVSMINHLALKNALSPFKIVYFYSQIEKERIRDKLEQGVVIDGLDGRPSLTIDDLDQTDRIMAVAGVKPFIKALEMGADVIIGGRSREEALVASAALYEGFSEPLAYDFGCKLAHISLSTELSLGSETVIGRLTNADVSVIMMHPQSDSREMLPAATHQLREHSLDLTGFQNLPGLIREATPHQIPLEGVGKIGERCIGIVHLKTPVSLAHLDTKVDAVQQQIRKYFSEKHYQLICKVYTQQPLLSLQCQGSRIPVLEDMYMVIEVIAETEQMAEEITVLTSRYLFASLRSDSAVMLNALPPELMTVLPAPAAYRKTIHHILSVDDPLELFEMHELLVK